VAVGLRLGTSLCAPHTCPCGATVDARGNHGLACRRSMCRQSRHALINDQIQRALLRATIPAVKEPAGLSRSDGKRPDGVTLIPWQNGKCLTWDVTVPDTLAASHLAHTALFGRASAEKASQLKKIKYSDLARSYDFCAIAIETLGPINIDGLHFLEELGRRMTVATGDPRECSFLLQRISIIIQRCNAIAFRGSFLDTNFTTY